MELGTPQGAVSPGRNPEAGFLPLILGTSVGKKAIMAVTGTILVAFVVVHMLGNLQVYMGSEALNRYAHFLRIEPALLWVARLVLLATGLTHGTVGFLLWMENRRARPQGYACSGTVQATLASRTMIYTGLVVFGFIIYHILHLTLRVVGPAGYTPMETDVYRNVVAGFSDPVIAVLYIVGQLLLFFHLSHGIQSLFQSLGFRHPRYQAGIQRGGTILAFVIAAGNISIPVAVLLHRIK
jgi:succinate dehydrogenase / fumarate reductase, cytochrome b subunit